MVRVKVRASALSRNRIGFSLLGFLMPERGTGIWSLKSCTLLILAFVPLLSRQQGEQS